MAAISSLAAPFDEVIEFTQPDGTRIKLHGWGHEFYAVFETLDGYTVAFDQTRKAYCYAQLAPAGELISSGVEVHRGNPATLGLNKGLRMSAEVRRREARARYLQWEAAMQIQPQWEARKAAMHNRQPQVQAAPGGAGAAAVSPLSPPSSTTTGLKVGFTILIDFSDDVATVPQTNIIALCNADGYAGYGNNGSVKQYYYDNSGGLLTYTNTVTFYIRAPQPKPFYNNTSVGGGTCATNLLRQCVDVMTNLSNYTTDILPLLAPLTVDGNSNAVACNVFFAGNNSGVWSYGLWPCSTSLGTPLSLPGSGKKLNKFQISNIGTSLVIGTLCHENGHMLCGFPDIYDYAGDSRGGAGVFCIMNSGGPSTNPCYFCSYLKRAAGWITPIELDSTSVFTATVTASAGSTPGQTYRYRKPGVATEYFLIENRQKTGRDIGIAASGVAIWHCDELGNKDNQSLMPNSTHSNYEVSLIQADNLWHFQNNVNGGDSKDLYYAGNTATGYKNEFTDYSYPGARWWDGTLSGVRFCNFSASSATMTFTVGEATSTENGVTTLINGTNATAAGAFTLGTNGSFNTLVITNGGVLAVTNGNPIVITNGIVMAALGDGVIGNTAVSGNNTALVTGAGSFWSNAASLYVGSFGGSNNLTVANGGQTVNTSGFIGYGIAANNNSVQITGSGSIWSNSSSLYVGYYGCSNSMTVAAGARVFNGYGNIGNSTGSVGNRVLVTDAGSVWSNGNNLMIGNAGAGSTLTITNGGRVLDAGGNIGWASNSTGNLVLVAGSDSTWSNSGSAYVGVSGFSNSLVIANSGVVMNASGYIGYNASASNNSALVTDPGSLWTNSGSLYVGNNAAGNHLTIVNGGQVIASGAATIGSGTGAYANSLMASGAGYIASAGLAIGASGSRSNLVTLQSNTLWNLRGGSLTWGSGAGAFGNSLSMDSSSALTNIYGLVLGDNGTTFFMTNSAGGLMINGLTTNQLQFSPSGLGGLTVGSGSSRSTTLIVSNYALKTTASSYVGNSGTNCAVFVAGPAAVWTNSGGTLYVGYSGLSNNLSITSGGQVFDTTGYLGYSGSNSWALVSGGSLWSNSSSLTLGNSGSGNNLIVTNSGLVADTIGYIGYGGSTSNNSVLVSGPGSVWSNNNDVHIGYNGSSNSLTIANGGKVLLDWGYIGDYGTSSNNAITVTGAGSLMTNKHILYVGATGPGNSLTIANGGEAINTSGYLGFNLGSSNNSVAVTGAGSVWLNTGVLSVGYRDSSNNLTVANGGQVFDTSGSLADNATSSNNWVLVTGLGSIWSNSGTLYVGNSGFGNTLIINNGASLASADGKIGFQSGSTGNTVAISGAGSSWTNVNGINIGDNGVGNMLTISNGASVTTYEGKLGYAVSSRSNLVVVTDTGSVWNVTANLWAGDSGSGNNLIISNGASVVSRISQVGHNNNSSSNNVIVTGPASLWNSTNQLIAGNVGSYNQLSIANNGTVLSPWVVIGQSTNVAMTGNFINVAGGNLLVTNAAATGTLDVQRGTLALISGTVIVNQFYATNFASSVVNIRGGSLTAPMLLNAGQFTMTGGTLTVAGAFTNAASGAFNLSGGSVIVPLQMNNLGAFIQNGGLFDPLVFTNSGSFVLNSGTNMDGVFLNLASGTVQQSGGEHDVNVATNYGSWTISGGVANLTNVVIDSGGVFTNAGGLLVSTNALGTGGVDVRNGTLVLNSGTVTVNQFYATNFANSIVNFNGGTLNSGGSAVNNGSTFVVGNTGSGATLNLVGGSHLFANGVTVGNSGSANGLSVANGAVAQNLGDTILGNAGSGSNVMLVTGAGSVWSNSGGGSLVVGHAGSFNTLIISNSGSVVVYYESFIEGTYNNALVTGVGSIFKTIDTLSIGNGGTFNKLTIANGGTVTDYQGAVGYYSGNNNSVWVTDPGSVWSNNYFDIGGLGGNNGNLTITNGGKVIASTGYLNGGTNNSVLVTGSGSVVSVSSMDVGDGGATKEILTITNGGLVADANGYVGYNYNNTSSDNNSALVAGAGSVWSNSAFYVGYGSSWNHLMIANSGTVCSADTYIGSFNGNDAPANGNSALVTGSGSVLSNSSSLVVGHGGYSNQLTVVNGGQVIDGTGYIGYDDRASNNSVVVTGSGSVWSNTGNLYVGYNLYRIPQYVMTMSNQLTVGSGALVSASNVIMGYATNSILNALTISGGSLFATNTAGNGTLEVRNGTLALISGTVTVSQFYATNFANSIVNFNGGTLNSGGSAVNNGSVFQVGNGSSAASLDLLGGTHSFANGLFINTNAILAGTGAITGSITDAGLIAPGNGFGVITDTGNLTLLGGGAMTMELGGTNAWLYDQFDLTGALTFGGTLTLTLLNGYTPQAGDQFNLFDFGSSSGAFSLTNLPTLSPTLYWNTSALYSTGVIEADQIAGSLQVTLAPQTAIDAGAKWQVDADGNWHTNNETVGGLLVGSHTVSYTNLIGWIAPTNQSVQIVSGATTTNTGTYQLTPLLLAAVSRKTQGAGTFDLNLNLNGVPSATVEPRASGPAQLVFTFNKAMAAIDGTLDATEFTVTNATFVSASIVSSNLTLNLTSVVDQSKVTVVMNGLTDLAGNPLSGTNAVIVRSLYGDVNQSGTVNAVDLQQTKNNLLATLTPANFLCDVNCSGIINAVDLQQIKNNLLHSASLAGSGAAQTLSSSDAGDSLTASALATMTLGQALGAINLTWSTNGDAPWTATLAEDGSQAAWSGSIGNLNVSWVETTVAGQGTLSFDWMVSSELNGDYLTFAIDGVNQPGAISGEAGWQTLTFNIPAGTHRLTWTYSKNAANASGLDAGWLRRVVYR